MCEYIGNKNMNNFYFSTDLNVLEHNESCHVLFHLGHVNMVVSTF